MVESIARNPKTYENQLLAVSGITQFDFKNDSDNINGQPENIHAGELTVDTGEIKVSFLRNGTEFTATEVLTGQPTPSGEDMTDNYKTINAGESFQLDKLDINSIRVIAVSDADYRFIVL